MIVPNKTSYLVQSTCLHLFFIGSLLLISFLIKKNDPQNLVEFRVIDAPEKLKVSNIAPLKSAPIQNQVPKPAKKKPKLVGRKVYGVTKKAITSTNENAIQTKLGNTISKELDQDKLNKGDEESLPIPEEDYLVTNMPRVVSEFRAPYPQAAKDKGIEGKVILEILIDQKGEVRKVTFISGPGYGLNEAAMESIKKFKFSPAKIGDQNVAVVIRYGINFVLED